MVEEKPWICGVSWMCQQASSPSVGLVDLMSLLGQGSNNIVMKDVIIGELGRTYIGASRALKFFLLLYPRSTHTLLTIT